LLQIFALWLQKIALWLQKIALWLQKNALWLQKIALLFGINCTEINQSQLSNIVMYIINSIITFDIGQFLTLNRTVVFLSLYCAIIKHYKYNIMFHTTAFTFNNNHYSFHLYKGLQLLDKFYIDMTPICFS
jgi:hypothetical protein